MRERFPPRRCANSAMPAGKQENGWNDLTQNWAFKHDFLHACRHRPGLPGPGCQVRDAWFPKHRRDKIPISISA
jgi:hypothetical protein